MTYDMYVTSIQGAVVSNGCKLLRTCIVILPITHNIYNMVNTVY